MVKIGTRVLITGASGLLGKYLTYLAPVAYNTVGTSHTSMLPSGILMDLADKESVTNAFDKVQPQVVIHCAAIGSVDYCEKHPHDAYDINVKAVEWLVDKAKACGSEMVFISSNAVFDGQHSPYSEDDERKPINVYGRLKVEAEDIVRQYDNHIIVRPIMLYGFPYRTGRGNWATRVLDVRSNGAHLKVVDDVVTQPTYARDVADFIWELIPRTTGTYHVATSETMTLYEFALQVAEVWDILGTEVQIYPAKSSDFKSIAPRPADTTYCLDKLWNFVRGHHLGKWPSTVHAGLERMRCE